MSDNIIEEHLELTCSHCGGTDWKIRIYWSNGRTKLTYSCSTPECIEDRREELGGSEGLEVVWGEFDITGQGYEPEDYLEEEKMLN